MKGKLRNIFLPLFFLLLLMGRVEAQPTSGTNQEHRKSVVIRAADKMASFSYKGHTIQRLLGNVIIDHLENDVVVTCDSVYMYTYAASDSLDLFGNIEMFHQASTIRCDKMTYDGIWARVRGHIVHMVRENMTLLTQYFDYHVANEYALYEQGGTVDRNGELLESDRGYYDAKTDKFIFAGNVAVKNENRTIACDSMHYVMNKEDILFIGPTKIWQEDSFISANYGWQNKEKDELFFSDSVYICTKDNELWTDSLYYYQNSERGRLYGNIQALDTVQSAIIFGDQAHFTQVPEFVEVTKNPAVAYYTQREESKNDSLAETEIMERTAEEWELFNACPPVIDTLILVADTIRSVSYPNPDFMSIDSVAKAPNDSLYRKIFAYPNVRAHRFDIQAVCDSMVVNSLDSIAYMYKQPVIWNDSTQIASDSVRFNTINQALNAADFYGSAFISMKEDSARFSQVKGRNMKAFFANNAIYKLDVYGNSESLYYMREDNEITTANRSQSMDMEVAISESKVQRVKYIHEVDSKIYPIEMLPEEDKRLKGFTWQEDRRPKSRQELFTRTVHSSQRVQTEQLEQPTFSTTIRLKELEKKSWIFSKINLPPLTER